MTNAPAMSGEHVIRVVNQHWIKYVVPVFIYLMLMSMSILLFVLAGTTAHHSMWLSHWAFIAALVLFLFTHHWFFMMLLCESTAHLVITNKRVIWLKDRLFVDEQMMEFSFDKLKKVEANKKGILQTVLRYGSLTFDDIKGASTVAHPNRVAKDIEQAMGMN